MRRSFVTYLLCVTEALPQRYDSSRGVSLLSFLDPVMAINRTLVEKRTLITATTNRPRSWIACGARCLSRRPSLTPALRQPHVSEVSRARDFPERSLPAYNDDTP